jgi:septum formation protein
VQSPRLILASGSPRRRELLEGLGLRFTVTPADVDESPLPAETPEGLVHRLAAAKAAAVASSHRNALVIAADTVVVVDGRVLGKPRDAAENRAYLRDLTGRRHTVLTGHALALGDRCEVEVCRTEVLFRDLDPDEIERYVASGEGLDKAGGYGIQGLGAALVPRVEGCYFNVVGLSLATVVAAARRLGVALV